jgi:hypothetical protein
VTLVFGNLGPAIWLDLDLPDQHTTGVRSDPGFMRSRGGQHNQELEVAGSAPIGLESSIVDSMGHGLSRKTYSYNARPIVLRLRTTSRGQSSARADHLTVSRLSSSPSLSSRLALASGVARYQPLEPYEHVDPDRHTLAHLHPRAFLDGAEHVVELTPFSTPTCPA